MKRFWKTAAWVCADGQWIIELDGRPVRTPARAPLAVPAESLAESITTEWNAAGEDIDPHAMPLTGLANAAIDRIAPDPETFAADLARYGESDLLCYRADSPDPLVARQAAVWDPLLAWAQQRYDIHFETMAGVMHRPQPPATIARLGEAVAAFDPFQLAALSPLTTIGGSLVVSLALAENAIDPDAAFAATHLDELWQTELWGEDQEAAKARVLRKTDFLAAARLLDLLGA